MNKVICKNCGCENTSDDIFCKKCSKLIMTSEYIENTEEKKNINPEPEKMPEVQQEFVLDGFENPEEPEYDPQRNKMKIIIISAIAAVVLIIAAVAGLFASGIFSSHDANEITEEVIITDLNKDAAITTVKVGEKDVEFSVSSVEIKDKTISDENSDCIFNVSVIRRNEQLEVNPVDYDVVYKSSFSGYEYKSATAMDGAEITLKPLTGADVELAHKKVAKIYDGLTFKKHDTDLEKGVDKIYFNIDNDTNEGSVCVIYNFDETKGWKFKEINEDELGFKAGVSHKEDGLYTNSAVRNIMFFGVDAEGYSGRSDCMMLVSIDMNTSKIKLTSFMRDTYVQIPGYGGNKLNSAFALGGPELATSAIANTYGIKIDNYAATNFTTFKNIINSLGGVTVNITADEAGYINWQLSNNGQTSVGLVPSSGGNVTLNGQQALWLCRDRGGNGFSGDDFVRTSRQRRVIKSLISSYQSYSPTQVLSTLKNLVGNVNTDLGAKDLEWLADNSGKFFDFEIEERTAPDNGEWSAGYSSAGAWIISVNNWDQLKSDVQKFIYEDLE